MNPRTVLLLIIWLAAALAPCEAQTVDEVIARAIAARGGAARIQAIQTQRLTGTISFGGALGTPLMVEMKRPGKMREEVTIDGKKMIRTTDAVAGWISDGSADPQPLSAEILKNMAGSADIDGPLLSHKAGSIVLEGKEQIEGKDCYKLVIQMKDGQVRTDYIDADSYLETKWKGHLRFDGQDHEVESYFRDYRKVADLMYPFTIDSLTMGLDVKQKIVLDRVEVNVPIDDSHFGKP